MPRRATKREPSEKRMLSWRESEEVVQVAIAIAEEEDTNKQTTFSSLFRDGIALRDLQNEVRDYIKTQRLKEVEAMERSKDGWLQSEAKSRRTMLTLYEPTDGEIMDYIREATYEKMHPKSALEQQFVDEESASLFPDGVTVTHDRPYVDEETVVVKVGADAAGEGGVANLTATLCGVLGDGGALAVELWGGALRQASRIPSSDLVGDDDSSVSIQDDAAFDIRFADGKIVFAKSLRDEQTGDYDDPVGSHDFPCQWRPESIVIEWLEYAVSLSQHGISGFHLPEPVDVGPSLVVTEYEGYRATYDKAQGGMQVLRV